jgi:branched-chain amino acid transport system ATP-binding protein
MNFVMSVCDELVVLDFGRQIAEGPPDKVRNDPAVIAAYLGEDESEAGDHVSAPAAVPAATTSQEEAKQ